MPSRVITAGSTTARMIVASIRMALASPTPSCFMSNVDSVPKMPNTPTITTAALVTTPAERVMPWATASRFDAPSRYASRIRLTTNTW